MSSKFNLPSITKHPDNTYSFTDEGNKEVVSWDFEVGDKKARLGFIQPNFEGEFPVDNGGEQITLVKPEQGTYLAIAELDDAGVVRQSHVLTEDGEQVYIPGGQNMRVTTASKIVEYVCVYPGQPAES